MESYVSPVVLQYGHLLGEKFSHASQEITTDLEKLLCVLESDPQGWHILSHGGWSTRVQEKIMKTILQNLSVHPLTLKFVLTLIRHRRLKKLPSIITWFQNTIVRGQKSPVFLKTAKQLTESSKQALTQTLSHLTGSGTTVHITTDPHLLGGALLFWKDLMIDGSIQNLLRRIKVSSLKP